MKIHLAIIRNIRLSNFNTKESYGHRIDLILPSQKYVMAVDPSTSSSGVIFGNLDTKEPEYMMSLARDTDIDEDHNEYREELYKVMDYWFSINHEKIKDIKIEQPIKGRKQTHDNFSKQMAVYHIFSSLSKKYNVNLIATAATTWKSRFLAKYKTVMNLDLRKANKQEIFDIASTSQKELLQFSKKVRFDVSDAYGLFKHYLAVDYSDTGEIVATADNFREKTHKLFKVVSNRENLNGYLETFLDMAKSQIPTAQLKQFTYNHKLSFDDNIRCFTSKTTNEKFDIYFAEVYPSIGIIREILKYRQYIGNIDTNTPLYLIGYRVNK